MCTCDVYLTGVVCLTPGCISESLCCKQLESSIDPVVAETSNRGRTKLTVRLGTFCCPEGFTGFFSSGVGWCWKRLLCNVKVVWLHIRHGVSDLRSSSTRREQCSSGSKACCGTIFQHLRQVVFRSKLRILLQNQLNCGLQSLLHLLLSTA